MFTDRQVRALRSKEIRYEKKEPGRTGLAIRVTPSGRKTWCFVYRFNGVQKRMVFGNYPQVGVADAHVALASAKHNLGLGVDPGALVAEERAVERNAETVDQLVDEYLERHARPNLKPSTAAEDERMLRREVLPYWKGRKAKEITRRDIIRVLDKIEDRGTPVLRNRVCGVISRAFRFALDRGILDATPAAGMRRIPEKSRDRFLSTEEIRNFWLGLSSADMTASVQLALKWLLVTGQRRAEVAGTVRSEIDTDEALWTLPSERTKNGRANLIPLPPLALSLLSEADRNRVRPITVRQKLKGQNSPDDNQPSAFLFPSWRLGKPLEPAALTRALNRNRDKLGIGDATVHDLRRTFASWHGELATAPEILSALLNHAPVTITGRVYNRSTNLELRRKAMQTWCAWLDRVIAGEQVTERIITFRRAAG